jgi:hypothetical protein
MCIDNILSVASAIEASTGSQNTYVVYYFASSKNIEIYQFMNVSLKLFSNKDRKNATCDEFVTILK